MSIELGESKEPPTHDLTTDIHPHVVIYLSLHDATNIEAALEDSSVYLTIV